jgi:hypothetical protein
MTEKRLADSLLACDAASPCSHALLSQLHARDRLRLRLLGGATMLMWMLATLSIVLLVWFYFEYVQPKLAKLSADSTMPEVMQNFVDLGELVAQYIACVATAMLLAALSTVWLVFATRRATIRQVSEQLATISRQLSELRELQLRESGTRGPPGP